VEGGGVSVPTWEVITGDCLEVLKGMEGGSVDAVVTDPPFGIGYVYGQGKEVASDPQAYGAFILPVIQECKRVAKPGALFAVWQTQLNYRHFWTWFGDDIHVYAAAKNFVQLRKTPINYGYDPVVMWYQPGTPLRPAKPRRSIDFFVANTAAVVSDPTRIEKGHPCPRPLDQVAEIVANFTPENGVVLDPFAGSGTTGVACLQAGRQFIGVEVNDQYADLARRRLSATLYAGAVA
jgi:DNA modification methylase